MISHTEELFSFFIIEFSLDNMKIYSYMYDYIFYLIFSIHPTVHGHLSCLQILTLISLVNTRMQTTVQDFDWISLHLAMYSE